MTNAVAALFCWSGGKDSAFALHDVRSSGEWDVRYLLTTLSSEHRRISMHGVREELLDMQAAAIGLPLIKVWVGAGTNEEYERQMEAALLKAKAEGITHVIFGDIFLEDLREYREQQLARVGMKAVFPLWKRNTEELVRSFIDKGFRTVICCVNDGWLGVEFAGREIDEKFLAGLPEGVDACGENGEYHTFCYAGPIYRQPIGIALGDRKYVALDTGFADGDAGRTKGFWYCDLLVARTD